MTRSTRCEDVTKRDPIFLLDRFFDWAAAIPGAIPFDGLPEMTAYRDDGVGWISWPAAITQALTEGAATASRLGFAVRQCETGFRATLPHRSSIGSDSADRPYCLISVKRTVLGDRQVIDLRCFDAMTSRDEAV